MQWNEMMSLERQAGREEARYEDIDKLVADGLCDAKRACNILGVDIESYNRYLSGEYDAGNQ